MNKIIGLDFGTVRIGVAISDARQIIARSVETLKNDTSFFQQIKNLMNKEGNIEAFVLGLPLQLNGSDSPMTQLARQFAKQLENQFNLPVHFWDERLTSAFAERSLTEQGFNRKKRAQLSDTVAAVLILQSYLDQKDFAHLRHNSHL